tara:strand:- start:148 stop:348 length:201 start_codon:yes stop_codon:yes gene_type:complete
MISLLGKYTAIAETMSSAALLYAIGDIKSAWRANPEFEAGVSDYSKKLWAEWDAYTVEMQHRRAAK